MPNTGKRKISSYNNYLEKDLKLFEKGMISSWHQAMGNDTLTVSDTIIQAGVFTEKLFRALYIRKFNKNSERFGLDEVIKEFSRKRILENNVKSLADSLRIDSNNQKHYSLETEEFYRSIGRSKCIKLLEWYLQSSNARLGNLKIEIYKKLSNEDRANTLNSIMEKGVFTEEEILNGPFQDKVDFYEQESLDGITDTPVYAGLLIDKSGSMCHQGIKVIEGQNRALNALRKSHVCENELLYIFQQTFHHDLDTLNPLRRLDSGGNDDVVILRKENYDPINGFGMTYLYDSIFQHVMLLTHEAYRLKASKFRKPQITIGVMTDGADNTSQKYSAKEVKKLIDNLRVDGMLKSAVIIGWNTPQFTKVQLSSLGTAMGFDEYIALDMADEQSIRRAFDLWSQLPINAQKG